MIAYRSYGNIISLFILCIIYRCYVKCYMNDQLPAFHEKTEENATEIEMSKQSRTGTAETELDRSKRRNDNAKNTSEEFDINKHLAEKKKKKYEPNINEPYWSSGEHVFERTAPPWPTKTAGSRTSVSVRTLRTKSPTPPNSPSHSCNQICPKIYETYGTVCGIYVHHFQNRVTMPADKRFRFFTTNFENACELERENCRHPTKEWYISYRGPCLPELKATPLIPDNVVSRAKFWAPFDQTTEIWMLNRKYSTVLQN